jgi:hypothetical protein
MQPKKKQKAPKCSLYIQKRLQNANVDQSPASKITKAMMIIRTKPIDTQAMHV